MNVNYPLENFVSLARSTHGDIPPPVVGCSFTLIGTKLYVFAGRLVSNWCLTNDLYVLDLESYVWTKIHDSPTNMPDPRYFHSADTYMNSIYVFGGIGISKDLNSHCVLDDIAVFDISFGKWKKIIISPSMCIPKPRYAHLSVVTMNYLMIIGGQDLENNYIEETSYFDMNTYTWVSTIPFNRHCGLYRSFAVCKTDTFPECSLNFTEKNTLISEITSSSQTPSFQHNRRSVSVSESNKKLSIYGDSPISLHYSQSKKSNDDIQKSDGESISNYRQYSLNNPIYIYSNYNFKNVKNELYVISSPLDDQYDVIDISNEFKDGLKPPGLRFPSGGILGNHFVIFGTYLTNTTQSYTIWCIDLNDLTWSKIDPGPLMNKGSWNKGIVDYDKNSLLIFGNKERNLVEDYNLRRINFDHIILVELEAFGIYRVTIPEMSSMAQELGLMLLEDPSFSDMEILTQDNIVLPCSTKVLSTRWPRFQSFLKANLKKDSTEFSTSGFLFKNQKNTTTLHNNSPQTPNNGSPFIRFFNRSRTLYIPHPSSVVQQFLRFLYTYSLDENVLNDISALFALLSLSKSFGPDLEVKDLSLYIFYALQKSLTPETASSIYEMAVLYGHRGLQIRALKIMPVEKK